MATRQLKPKRSKRGTEANMKQKICACLLMMEDPDAPGEPLIKGDERYLSEHGIYMLVQFDHARRKAQGGSNAPQNLTPRRKAAHAKKSVIDNREIKKGNRLRKSEKAHRERIQIMAPEIDPAEPGGDLAVGLAAFGEQRDFEAAKKAYDPDGLAGVRRGHAKIRSAGFQKGHRPLRSRNDLKKKPETTK
jgi:hypothetical protein